MADWKTVPLSDALDFQEGPGIMAVDFKGEGVPLIRIAGLKRGSSLLSGCNYLDPEKVSRKWDHFRLREGDVLLSTSASLGEVATVDRSAVGAVAYTGIIRFRPKRSDVNARFIEFLLTAPSFKWQIEAMGVGSVMKHFGPSHLRQMTVDLPSLGDQQAISEVLGALDEKIAVNERIADTADELTHALFAQRFPAGVDRRHESGWRSGCLSDICVTQYGYTASSSPEPVGPKFLRVKDINKRNWIDWHDVPYCEIDRAGSEKYSVGMGDILVARMADPGKSAIVEEPVDAVFASYLVRLKTESLAHSYFLWGFLKSAAYERYVASSRGGSVQANMNAKVIVAAELDIPPMGRMEEYFRQVTPLRTRLNSALRESRTLAALRDTLLPQLMSGRIRVKDAEKIVEDHV
ncbi:restriction endonuclease subunit S [Streptomyces rubiginosohelvolus]